MLFINQTVRHHLTGKVYVYLGHDENGFWFANADGEFTDEIYNYCGRGALDTSGFRGRIPFERYSVVSRLHSSVEEPTKQLNSDDLHYLAKLKKIDHEWCRKAAAVLEERERLYNAEIEAAAKKKSAGNDKSDDSGSVRPPSWHRKGFFPKKSKRYR